MNLSNQSIDYLQSNISNLISVDFEKIEFVDPYSGIWLRLITIVVYIIELLACTICLAFVIYEQGYGHFRTLINQLLSHLYAVVSTYLLFNRGSLAPTVLVETFKEEEERIKSNSQKNHKIFYPLAKSL